MINWFSKIQNEYKRDELHKETLRLHQLQDKKLAQIKEVKELQLITINNVRYIKAYLNTLHSVVNYVKGNDVLETKRKKEWAKSNIKWLQSKLLEEESMILHWGKTLKKLTQ
jgi:hypothetical protein